MVLAPDARPGVMVMVSVESPRIEGLALEILDRLTGGTEQSKPLVVTSHSARLATTGGPN